MAYHEKEYLNIEKMNKRTELAYMWSTTYAENFRPSAITSPTTETARVVLNELLRWQWPWTKRSSLRTKFENDFNALAQLVAIPANAMGLAKELEHVKWSDHVYGAPPKFPMVNSPIYWGKSNLASAVWQALKRRAVRVRVIEDKITLGLLAEKDEADRLREEVSRMINISSLFGVLSGTPDRRVLFSNSPRPGTKV